MKIIIIYDDDQIDLVCFLYIIVFLNALYKIHRISVIIDIIYQY
jgi:hypothetical protein